MKKIDTSSAMGRLFFKIIAALVEFEREQISERTSDAMQRLQESGKRMSQRLPYGWMHDPNDYDMSIPCPEERDIIAKIITYYQAGCTFREIGRRLEQEGIFCRGGVWYHQTIQSILRRYNL